MTIYYAFSHPYKPLLHFAALTLLLGFARPLFADSGANELSKSASFQVKAVIANGCIVGSSGTDTTTFGSMNFGTVNTLATKVSLTSTPNSGSVVLKCTLGTPLIIGLDAGLNAGGSISGGRFLQQSGGATKLRYQLFQNANFSTAWGSGANGGNAMNVTATGVVTEYKVYANLYAATTAPAAGTYNDTVTVIITY